MKNESKPNIHIFVISWKGQHSNAVFIAKKLKNLSSNICIVYSDPDENFQIDAPCKKIKRPNNLFWADKFKSCLEACGDHPILVIHADCVCSNWQELVQRCHSIISEMPHVGVWAPKIDWVGWLLKRYVIAQLRDDIFAVGRTDGIIFYLAPSVIKRMKCANYDDNIYGRGIELMFVMAAYAQGLIAVIDTSIMVKHPKSSGYDQKEANIQMNKFLKQLTTTEEIQRRLFNRNRQLMGGPP